MKKPWWIASIVIVVVLGVLFAVNVVAVMNAPSDEQQIRTALEEMRKASIDGRPGGVQEYLSNSFELPEGAPQDGGLLSGPKAKVADAIRKSKVNYLTLSNITIEISGINAIARCDVDTEFTYMMFPAVTYAAKDIQIEFRKEGSRRLFVIPEPKWRVLRFSNVRFSDLNL